MAIESKSPRSPRISSLDIARGIAVLFMLQAHINIIVPFLSDYARIFATPTFLFVAGVGLQLLFRSRHVRQIKTTSIFLEVFWRAVTLLIITSLITWTANLFLPYNMSIFTNIFVIMFTGFLVGFLVHKSLTHKILAIIIIFAATLLIHYYHLTIFSFLTGNLNEDVIYVTVLPFVCYFIFGQIAFDAYKKDKFNLKNNYTLLKIAALYLAINLAIWLIFPYNFSIQGRDYFPEFLMITSLLTLIIILLVRTVDLKGNLHRLLRPIENIGHISFTGYYISYTSFVIFGAYNFYQNPIPVNLTIFTLTTIGLVILEKIWRPYNYAYGFEWWYRKISTTTLQYTQKYLLKGKQKFFPPLKS
jgi:Heparan-alpha-glucosaminide N-acetyltransferase, catalytic